MKARIVLLTSLLLVTIVASCSDSGDDNPTGPGNGGTIPDTVSFAANIRPLVASRCALVSCHGSLSGSGGLAFNSTNPDHSTITTITSPNGRFVVPGSSATSNFYLKVIPVVPTPPGGPRMPFGLEPLNSDLQNAIKRWIDQGAMDN